MLNAVEYVKLMREVYRDEIYQCLEFWQKNGIDEKYGGITTSLDREGKVFQTDKSVWFQGRGLYTFSKAYNSIENKPEWLKAAHNIYHFLKDFCFDSDRRMFFVVTQDGKPVQKRRYYFSETFAATGFAEYYKATGDRGALELARTVYRSIMNLYRNPNLSPPKYNPEVVRSKALNVPMIIIATAQVLRDADPENSALYGSDIDDLLKELFDDFLKPDEMALFENVGLNGERLDSPNGRLINPGHSIEAAWFILKEGIFKKDATITGKALDIMNWSYEAGWDKKYGGLLYFVDIEGKPSEKLEWDMKLWWPHSEGLIAFLMAYCATGEDIYIDRFKKVHDYTFGHFRDYEYGEWYGYLHHDGTVSNYSKGNIFKGPFHIPRALILCYLMLCELT
jgi:N-acylglucosamine 2-epimerase